MVSKGYRIPAAIHPPQMPEMIFENTDEGSNCCTEFLTLLLMS
jgi:hypothetical protein